jgi:putative redox protein
MKASLRLDHDLRFIGRSETGHETAFDTTVAGGGSDSTGSPMEILLEAASACASMDVLIILRKKRRTVTALNIELDSERATTHPKVFVKIHMSFKVTSPDATQEELERAVDLSMTTYCSVGGSLRKGGCDITWDAQIIRPD